MASYFPSSLLTGYFDQSKPIVPAGTAPVTSPTSPAPSSLNQFGYAGYQGYTPEAAFLSSGRMPTVPTSVQGADRASYLSTLPGAERLGVGAQGVDIFRLPAQFYGSAGASPDHPHIQGFAEGRGWQLTPEYYDQIAQSYYHKRGQDTDRHQLQDAAKYAGILAGATFLPPLAGGAFGGGGGIISNTANWWGNALGIGGAAAGAAAPGGAPAPAPSGGSPFPMGEGGGVLLPGASNPWNVAGGGGSGGGGIMDTFRQMFGGGGTSTLPPWAQMLSGVLGPAAGAYGAYQQGQAQEDVLDFMRGGQLPPINFSGGGITANDQGFDLGPWQSLYSNLRGAAEGVPLGNADTARAETLANLRARALPENQRAVNSTLTRLFSEGRLGSTGGANVIGRLAESQDAQDLEFQLTAGQEGRSTLSSNLEALQAYMARAGGLLDFGGAGFTHGLNRAGRWSDAYHGVSSGLSNAVFGGRYDASPMASVLARLFPANRSA